MLPSDRPAEACGQEERQDRTMVLRSGQRVSS
jgi:hypothetical protein